MGEKRVFMRKTKGYKPHGRPEHRRMIILKRTLKYDRIVFTGFIWLSIGTSDRLF